MTMYVTLSFDITLINYVYTMHNSMVFVYSFMAS